MWIRPAQRWENIEVRGGSGKVSGSGLARRYLGHTNRSRGKEYRPVANFLLSKRIDLDRRTKSEGYVSKSPISCKLPLGARIISIANALDAMLSDCHYRRYAFPMSHAREEIRRCAGTQFDPKIVEVFFTIPENHWIELRENLGSPFRLTHSRNMAH